MVKMILTVPQGFNAELFCNAATAMVKDAAENEYERRQYDYNLGEQITTYRFNFERLNLFEVNADFVDFAHLDALQQLQSICPQVEFYFENDGDGENSRSAYDIDYFDENYFALIKHA